MFKIFNKTVDSTEVIEHLEKNLTAKDEKCSWYVKEIATQNKEPLFTIHLSTLSRYFNMNLDITKLEIEASGEVKNSPYFSLNEATELIFNVRKHFNPQLNQFNHNTFFDTTPEKQKNYNEKVLQQLHTHYDKIESIANESTTSVTLRKLK